jgi:two-component system NtrC family sensor kinase
LADDDEGGMKRQSDQYTAMFGALVGRLILVTVLPLVVMGIANFYLFYSLNRSIVVEQHANFLRHHKESIETFLAGLVGQVSTLANQYSLAELEAGNLERAYQVIRQPAGVITDVGLIGADGRHLKYIGPYDLANRNYRDAEWFARVVADGVYVSDVFLGFRGVPHFVIAVKRTEGGTFWILRATVNTEYFSRLVDATRIGRTGETFIVNSAGLLQTKTRAAGELLAPSGYPDLLPHSGIQVRRIEQGGKSYLYTTTWLESPRWMLIFRQESHDVYGPLRQAVVIGLAMCTLGVLGGAALAAVVAGAQVRYIKRADREKEALTQRLLVAGKTAAVGEMSAGLAHEINNPLATIDTLQTWIRDLGQTSPVTDEDRLEILDSAAKIGEQVYRCKTITQGLLKFARKSDARLEQVDLQVALGEMLTILRTRARVEGVAIEDDLGYVPPMLACPAHLQQIFVNLINNAIDAVGGKPDARVLVRSRFWEDGMAHVEVLDNGCGIPAENLSSIFLPFFTTKAVGKGTGLGLAICYGLARDLGGTITVESTVGEGTAFAVVLPLRPPEPVTTGETGEASS